MSDQMIQKQVEVLEQPAAQGYSIDTENNVVMNAAPALPLTPDHPPHYTAEVAAAIISEKYQPWWNQVGRLFIAQQQQLAEFYMQEA